MAELEEKGEKTAEGKIKKISGWLTSNEGMTLAMLSENKICIEIGCFQGLSTNYICGTAKKLYTMDIFDYCTVDDFKKNTLDLNNLVLFEGDSHTNSKLFNKETIDFIFVDADHSYDGVKSDILDYFPLLKINGIIAFHDYSPGYHDSSHPGVKQAVDEFFPIKEGAVDSIVWIKKIANL